MSRPCNISVLCALALFFAAGVAHAATLTLGGGGSYRVGDTIEVPILVSTATGESANAVSASITYPSVLELVSISKAGSIVSIWPEEPSYSQSAGTAHLEGVILNPGWSGTRGVLATLVFRAKGAGAASVVFTDAHALANDGKGTDILTSAAPGSYTINKSTASPPAATGASSASAPLITSSTHPNQDTWYQATHVVLSWSNTPGTRAVKVGYDKNPQGAPSVFYAAISQKELNLKDGVWYFHVQDQTANGWGPVGTFKIKIDTTLPDVASGFPETGTTMAATGTPEVARTEAPKVEPPLDINAIIAGVALLMLALAGLWYLWTRLLLTGRGRLHASMGAHARHVVHREFEELKDAIAHEVNTLEKVRSRRSLTVEEERLINRFKKMLDKAESAIEGEIGL